MKAKRVLILALALCLCAASAQAVSSPMLENFSGSGIRKKEPAGKLQTTILSAMRAAGSVRFLDVITDRDTTVDKYGKSAAFQDGEIKTLFTPDVYQVKKDGTADLKMLLADLRDFKSGSVSVVVGIPQGNSDSAGVKYIEIKAEAKNGKIEAAFPAWVVTEMRSSITAGWNCVCMIVIRKAQEAPGGFLFEIPAGENSVSI